MTDDKEVRYQKVCAAAYQLAGLVDAPLRFLDALSDASNGEPMEDAIDLLPVTLDECGAMPDAARDVLAERQRCIAACEGVRDKSCAPEHSWAVDDCIAEIERLDGAKGE